MVPLHSAGVRVIGGPGMDIAVTSSNCDRSGIRYIVLRGGEMYQRKANLFFLLCTATQLVTREALKDFIAAFSTCT